MTTEIRRHGAAAVTILRMPLDYYLVLPEAGAEEQFEGIVVEEFELAEDHTATGLNTAGWTAAKGGWWSSAGFSRAMRADPDVRARVVPMDRRDAESSYRRLGGGDLPDEPALRSRFVHRVPLAGTPRRTHRPRPSEGFADKRMYRVLFANDLDAEALARVAGMWGMAMTDDVDPAARVVGTTERRTADDLFSWELRRIGPAAAWCVDLTACLGGRSDTAVRVLLWELRTVMRYAGLIPVTVERLG